MGSFNILSFLWLVIGCVIGFGAGILYLFLLGSSAEVQDKPNKSRLPFSLQLLRGGWTIVTLIATGGICYGLKLEKTVAILILTAAVLLIAKLAGNTYGLVASVLAVGLVAYFFLPPVGSFGFMAEIIS